MEAGYTVVVRTLRELNESRVHDGVPRLIITDVPEPRDAAPIVQALQEAYPGPILVLSARFRRGLATSADVARRLGVCKVLPKPCSREELLSAVSESIDRNETNNDRT